jgi:hypothetical protein
MRGFRCVHLIVKIAGLRYMLPIRFPFLAVVVVFAGPLFLILLLMCFPLMLLPKWQASRGGDDVRHE